MNSHIEGSYYYFCFGKKEEGESFSWSEKTTSLEILHDNASNETYYWVDDVMQQSDDGFSSVFIKYVNLIISDVSSWSSENIPNKLLSNVLKAQMCGKMYIDGIKTYKLIYIEDDEDENYNDSIFIEMMKVDNVNFDTNDKYAYYEGNKIDDLFGIFDYLGKSRFAVLLES